MASEKLFGHPLNRRTSAQPVALSEVSIVADPAVLRHLAMFLTSCADQLESGGKSFGHRHLADFERDKFDLEFDVIVATQEG